MKQFINKKSLRRMDLFVLRKQKKPLQPEPWCCASSSQGPARVFLYFDKLTHFQMKQERMVISPHKLTMEVLIPAASTLWNVQLSTSPPLAQCLYL